MFGVQFYPTPTWLGDKMMEKVDWSKVTYTLEPSAGKGDLVAAMMRSRQLNKKTVKAWSVECCEIDPNLRAVLEGRGLMVCAEDFLQYSPMTRYDLIAMNPPFRNGDKHLLHALRLLEHGGQCVCLLNAETLRNAESVYRQDLATKLEEYGADVEYIDSAFTSAERKAQVEVALIYVSIPYERDRDILSNLIHAVDMEEAPGGGIYDLVSCDPVEAMLQRYEFEAKLGLNVIDTFQKCQKYFYPDKEEFMARLNGFKSSILRLNVATAETELMEKGYSQQNLYLRELRIRYWDALFGAPGLQRLLTEKVAQQYRAEIQKFRDIDFTMDNINRLKLELSQSLIGNIEDAILNMFDKITYQNSMEKNGNVHYYSGWKSNSASRIKPRIIVPCWGVYERYHGHEWWQFYKCEGFLEELEKIFNYLDSGMTDGSDIKEIIGSHNFHHDYDGERVKCKFFDFELKKKGTIHIFFTDEKLLKRFNVYAARHKNWLPNDYGKKSYDQLTADEREVVDSFEGKKGYGETMQNPQYYLAGVNMLRLGAGQTAT